MDAGALVALYRKGQASPVEATRAALDRIERFNGAINAYTYVDADGALDAAHASARRWGQGRQLSRIDGVPVSLKDLTEVRGMPAREGSLTKPDTPCEKDAPPAAKLREAGAVLLGKTNTPEFGWKAVTDNRVYGTTCNPWDTRLTPGGSSGGAAAAAALNMGVLHQGGDSGGSIRIPAAFTGVFGFKPTFGWTPNWPPSKMATLSHLGPVTRTVDDAVRMLNVMGRYDFSDPYATRGQPDDWGAALGEGLDGLRIGYSPDLGYADVDPQIAQRIETVADELRALGAQVERVDPGIESPIDSFRVLWFTATQQLCSQMTDEQHELADPGLLECADRARDYRAIDMFRAEEHRARLTERLEHFNQSYHLLLTPTVPITPFAIDHQVPPDSKMRDWMEWAPFSYPLNLSQQPAASVPCGFTRQGLPIGFQLAAGKFDDTRILRACEAYLNRHPPRFPDTPDVERPAA